MKIKFILIFIVFIFIITLFSSSYAVINDNIITIDGTTYTINNNTCNNFSYFILLVGTYNGSTIYRKFFVCSKPMILDIKENNGIDIYCSNSSTEIIYCNSTETLDKVLSTDMTLSNDSNTGIYISKSKTKLSYGSFKPNSCCYLFCNYDLYDSNNHLITNKLVQLTDLTYKEPQKEFTIPDVVKEYEERSPSSSNFSDFIKNYDYYMILEYEHSDGKFYYCYTSDSPLILNLAENNNLEIIGTSSFNCSIYSPQSNSISLSSSYSSTQYGGYENSIAFASSKYLRTLKEFSGNYIPNNLEGQPFFETVKFPDDNTGDNTGDNNEDDKGFGWFNWLKEGFSSVVNFLGNIVDYLNPTSENFFGKIMVEWFIEGLKFLFVPDTDNINEKINIIKDKFAFIESIKSTINELVCIVSSTDTTSVFSVNVDSSIYTGKIDVINLSWYLPYKEYGDTLICAFCYGVFFWRIFVKLPAIIKGSSGSFITDDKGEG